MASIAARKVPGAPCPVPWRDWAPGTGTSSPAAAGPPLPHHPPILDDLVHVIHGGGEARVVRHDAQQRADRRRIRGLEFSVLLRERNEANRQRTQIDIANGAVAELRVDMVGTE